MKLSDQGCNNFVLTNLTDDDAAAEKRGLSLAARNADIGLLGFARSVDDTAHQSDLNGKRGQTLALHRVFKIMYKVDGGVLHVIVLLLGEGLHGEGLGDQLPALGHQVLVDRRTALLRIRLEEGVHGGVHIAGASAYPRIIDFPRLREIADKVGAKLFVDMAHIAGLVAAGEHPSPVPYADVVTTTTHKTLRGPRAGLILCREEYIKTINSKVFPGMQGGPLEHVIAAKAVCFGEAMTDSFKAYQKQVRINARVLADELTKRGFRMVSGGTDNHLMLVDLRPKQATGKAVANALDIARITVNKNMIPFDPEKPFVTSGIRIGTPAVTTRGMKEDAMVKIADFIERGVALREDEAALKALGEEVKAFTADYPMPQF